MPLSIAAAVLLAGSAVPPAAPPAAPGPPPAEATLLVSGYASNAVLRYEAVTGAFLDTLDPAGGTTGPLGIAAGPDGRLYVASETTGEVLRFDAETGAFVDAFVAAGTGGLSMPAAVVFGPDRSGDGYPDLYVSSFDGDSVLAYDGADGSPLGPFVAPGAGGLDGPDAGMTFGPDGNLYVPSYWTSQVLRYDGADGSFLDVFVAAGVGALSRPRTILFTPAGDMLVTSEGSNRVIRYDGATGAFRERLIAGIDGPTGMALDSAGYLYVAAIDESAVRRYVEATGALDAVVVPGGAGGLALPTFVLLLEACRSDLDASGAVDVADLLRVLAAWGGAGGPEDLDGSGTVAFGDVLVVLAAWGPCPRPGPQARPPLDRGSLAR